MKIAISLGGSLVFKDRPNIRVMANLGKLLSKMKGSFAIAVGGGTIARDYVNAAKKFTRNNFDLDEAAIAVTKANARLAALALRGRYAETLDEAIALMDAGIKIVVMGGTEPGQTTDAVASLLAEEMDAERLVNLSDVGGIFNVNPLTNKKAKKFKSMTHREFLKLTQQKDKRRPRENFIFDVVGANIIARSNIEAHFVCGSDMRETRNAIMGKKHKGTVVKT
jgi:uridylate kinase